METDEIQSAPLSCIACGDTHLANAFTARDIHQRSFRFLTCPQCDTLQIESVNEELLQYAYAESYYGGSDTKFKWPFSSLFDLGKQLAARKTSKLMPDKQVPILDVGCGKGDFLDKLQKLGHTHLYGNDIEKPARLPSHIQWVSGAFPRLEATGDQQFGLITLTHVFEHIPQPVKAIEQLYQLSASGGLVQLSQPNIRSRQAQQYQEAWLHLDPPRHLHLIPSGQLKKMFSEVGFELVSETYKAPLYNPFGYLQSWLNRRIAQRDLLYEFLKKGGQVKSLKQFFQLVFSFLYAGISFPFYFILDRSEARKGISGTVEFVFRKS